MNDPYAHLTPKPLDQQVPGAWNFVEPNPDERPTPKLDRLIQIPQPAVFATARLTLPREAREHLWSTGLVYMTGPDDPDWERFEDALLDVIAPVRYIVGIDPAAGDPARP